MAIDIDLSKKKSGGCGCGCGESTAVPELEVAALPKIIRHAAIIGGLISLPSGECLILRVSHDPIPLLNQLQQVAPDAFDLEYLDRGPEVFRLQFTKR